MNRGKFIVALIFLLIWSFAIADTIKHRFHNPTADLGNPNETGPDEWNDSLVVAGGATGMFLMRDSSQTDGWRWVTPVGGLPTSTPTGTPPTPTPTPTPGGASGVSAKYWLPVAACQNTTAGSTWDLPTSNPAVAACVTGSNTQKGVLDFADGANSLSAQLTLMLPSNFNAGGTTSALIKWLSSTTSGDVVWQLATICVADAETDDPAFNTASTVTDTTKGTTNQTNDASIATVTMTGCAAGELLHLKIFRDPTDGSDTMAGTARLIGVELTVPRT